MPIRTTEQSAPATLAELIPQLTTLTTEQPTTAEIEEALIKIVPAITRALADWLRSRHTISANAHSAGIPEETPEEREYLDPVETAHPHIFAPDLTPMEKPA